VPRPPGVAVSLPLPSSLHPHVATIAPLLRAGYPDESGARLRRRRRVLDALASGWQRRRGRDRGLDDVSRRRRGRRRHVLGPEAGRPGVVVRPPLPGPTVPAATLSGALEVPGGPDIPAVAPVVVPIDPDEPATRLHALDRWCRRWPGRGGGVPGRLRTRRRSPAHGRNRDLPDNPADPGRGSAGSAGLAGLGGSAGLAGLAGSAGSAGLAGLVDCPRLAERIGRRHGGPESHTHHRHSDADQGTHPSFVTPTARAREEHPRAVGRRSPHEAGHR
jgi:hypothetical protein